MKKEIEEILWNVRKPTRYIGNEWNAAYKNRGLSTMDRGRIVSIALAFPDTYEIGMSHLGMNILYHLLNSKDGIAAERVYAPWTDMESMLREKQIPLFTLESNTPVKDFDIVGFSTQYELSYTNILNMLDLSGIPARSSERGEDFPLVMAGGACAFNPEPLADFVDVFVIGEAEEAILEIVAEVQRHKGTKAKKQEILEEMAKIEGVYVPSLYNVSYNPDNTICGVTPKYNNIPVRIRKRIIENLDEVFYPENPVVPLQTIIHDRAVLEVMRGCTQGCRFCHAGMTNRPLRYRSYERARNLITNILGNTGWEEISFLSLSSCDYPCIKDVISFVMQNFAKTGVRVSLPSLRPDNFSVQLAAIAAGNTQAKNTLTFAPEAGTQKMRNSINKGVEEEGLFNNIMNAFRSGWDSCKLYYMIGLPGEEDSDLEGIGKLSKSLRDKGRSINRHAQVRIGISSFVPKAHTPFQWEAQDSIEQIVSKQRSLMGMLRNFELRWHKPHMSMLEGVFARGDRRLGQVLFNAWKNGAKFDSWEETFDYNKWERSFQDCGVDPHFYLGRKRMDEILPWDHIDTRVRKDFLVKENNKSKMGELSPNCFFEKCQGCGACGDKQLKVESVRCKVENQEPASLKPYTLNLTPSSIVRQRLRIYFSKEDELKFISHLDLQNVFLRAMRRAEIPFTLTGGFHPHVRFIMGLPMSVGMTSEAEICDAYLAQRMDAAHFEKNLSRQLPAHIKIKKIEEILVSAPLLPNIIKGARYVVSTKPNRQYDRETLISGFLNNNEIMYHRKTPKVDKMVNLRPLIEDMKMIGSNNGTVSLELVLRQGREVNPRADEVIRSLFGKECEILEIRRVETII